MKVEVWNYKTQCFIPSYPGGYKRLRVDYSGPLTDLGAFEVEYTGPNRFIAVTGKELTDWRRIDYS